MAVSIKVEGLAAARGAIRTLQRIAPEKLRAAVAESVINIHHKVTSSAPVDTGILRGSYKFDLSNGTVYSSSAYAMHVEFGTRPHFPPVAPLEDWARRHGMPPGTGFLIARKIAQRGTKAVPHLFPAAEAEKSNFIRNVSASLIEAAKESATK